MLVNPVSWLYVMKKNQISFNGIIINNFFIQFIFHFIYSEKWQQIKYTRCTEQEQILKKIHWFNAIYKNEC